MTREELIKALESAKHEIEKMNHLIDKPCEACDFHKENGCSRWDCIFEEINADE